MPLPTVGRRVLPLLATCLIAGCQATATPDVPGDGGGGGGSDVNVVPKNVPVRAGAQQAFASTPPAVRWSIQEGAAGGDITPSGLYTAPGTTGNFTIVAETESGLQGRAFVEVVPATSAFTHGLVITPEHPRLWFNSARLARARAWYAANPFTPSSSDRVGQALRGLLASDSASCRSAISWALATAADPGVFEVPGGTACDNCRWMGEQTILVYDWCFAFMTPDERASFRTNTTRWVENWRTKLWGGVDNANPENNYFLGYLRNELEWGIALYEDDVTAAERFLDYALVRRVADLFNPAATTGNMRGGAGREGSMYGRHHYGYTPIPWTTIDLLGRNIYDEVGGYWREVVYWLLYSTQPAPTTGAGNHQATSMGYTVWPFNDNEPSAWLGGGNIGPDQADFMTTAAMRWSTLPVGQHARQWLNQTAASRSRHVQAVDPGGTAAPFTSLPLDYYAAGAKYLYTRNAWGSAATTTFLKLGDGPGSAHEHTDWGTWQIWRNGRYLSRETVGYAEPIAGFGGVGTVSSSFHLGHNSLVVNGVGDSSTVWVAEQANVTRLESQPDYTFASVDLTAVGSRAAFVSWVRDFVFLRGLETLVILDRIHSSAANDTKTFLAHCETAPVTSATGAACTNGTQALVLTTVVPPPSGVAVRSVNEGGTVGQHRIEVVTTPGTAESYILTVLEAKDASASPLAPSVEETVGTPGSFTLTLDGTTQIVFEKGMASGGGSVTVGGVTTPLRGSVQPFAVTNAGPGWQ